MASFLDAILNQFRTPNMPNTQNQNLSPYSDVLGKVGAQYPALNPYLKDFVIQQGKSPNDGRQLEYYPPWEAQNPNAGKSTIELYKPMQGQELQTAIAGDALHYLGSIDPRTNKPINQDYYNMKQQLINSLTPRQQSVDQTAYQQELPMYKNHAPSYQDWMQSNRSDAYIRGYITPDTNDEWRRNNVYNQQQMMMLESMKKYLMGARH